MPAVSLRVYSEGHRMTAHLPVRIGILGNSDIARRKFVPALVRSTSADLAALGSRQLKGMPLPAEMESVPVMLYEELVSSPDVDVVYVSLPNHLHEEWSIRSLEQGKHVICEKPLSLSAASASRMFAAADAHGMLLYENLMYLQHPQHAAVKAIISSGCIGRVLSLHGEFTFPGPASGDFRLDPASGGGAFHDLNRYPLSAALYFLKGKQHEILRCSAVEHEGLNRAVAAETVTEAGERFTFDIAFHRPYRCFYQITGEQGSVRVERAFTTPPDWEAIIEVRAAENDHSFRVPPCDHFLATIDHACALVRNGHWVAMHERSRQVAGLAEQIGRQIRETTHD